MPRNFPCTILVAENSSTRDYLHVDVELKAAKDVQHSRFSHNPSYTYDCIPARYRQIIFIIEWADKNRGSSQLSYSYTHQHKKEEAEPNPPINISKKDIHSPRPF